MRKESANPDRFAAAIAARQHGVIGVQQLHDVGLDGAAITRRVTSGRLYRVHRGVYALGAARLTFEGRCMAAVLAAGRAAAISHRSAAELWAMLRHTGGPIHLTLASDTGRKPQVGIRLHRSRTLNHAEVTSRAGIPITRPARTLRDLRRVVDRPLYLDAVRRALDRRLISRDQLRSAEEVTRSELERRFVALCRRHALPAPLVNARVGRFEVDFLWIDHHLIAETDGWKTHGDRVSFESDRARDAELQVAGFRVVRFTYLQVFEEPNRVVVPLRRLMGL